jgi:ubiquinone biosynthesis protein
VGAVDALRAANVDMDKLVEIAATSFFNQVFRDGFFHADLHPGNLFVLPDGRLAVVDFGIMGRIDRESRLFLAQILWGFLKGDYHNVAQVHIDAGYVPAHQSVEHFAQACRAIAQPILDKPLHEISVARLLGQLFQVANTFEMEAQPQLLLLQKTMVLAEGVGRALSPNINMWKLAEPMIADWAKRNLSPQARLRDMVSDTAQALQRLPHMLKQVEQIVERVHSDGFTLHPDTVQRMRGKRQSARGWLLFGWATLAVAASALALEWL